MASDRHIATALCIPYVYYTLYHWLIIIDTMASMWWLPGGGFQKAVPDQVLALITISWMGTTFLQHKFLGLYLSKIRHEEIFLNISE